MTTWVIGDVHGCARELEALLAVLAAGPDDRLLSVGDLFHRGPDPGGVMDLCRDHGIDFVLGNHEAAVLRRTRLAPERADASDRLPLRTSFPPLAVDDLKGDGGRPLLLARERLEDFLVFLQSHAGFFATGARSDGRADFWVVHGGIRPGTAPDVSQPDELLYPLRTKSTLWYDVHAGPELVVFGHLRFSEAHRVERDGTLVAIGLDTGCVYGGSLTAFSPDEERVVSVPAFSSYAKS